MTKRFPAATAAAIDKIKYFRLRSGDHRFIAVWVVVIEGRVLVRSWNDKPGGWYRAFQKEPNGAIEVDGVEVPVKAVAMRSTKLNDAADAAYGEKYTTKANAKYVKGFALARRKSTTLELVPL